MREDYMGVLKKYLKDENYIVKDIDYKNPTILFILESPHNNEIDKKYSASGQSGKNMSEFMNISDGSKGLGEIAKNKSEGMKIDIMNICLVPLQRVYNLDKK